MDPKQKAEIAKKLAELEEAYYGEDEDDEEAVINDNYFIAEWSRDTIPELFNMIHKLLDGGETNDAIGTGAGNMVKKYQVARTSDGEIILGLNESLGFLPIAIFQDLPMAAMVAGILNKAPAGTITPEEFKEIMNHVESFEKLAKEYEEKKEELKKLAQAGKTIVM